LDNVVGQALLFYSWTRIIIKKFKKKEEGKEKVIIIERIYIRNKLLKNNYDSINYSDDKL